MVEVSTDKVDAEVPAPASGTVAKILVQPDETIEVGKPLAEIDPNGGRPSGASPPRSDAAGEAEPTCRETAPRPRRRRPAAEAPRGRGAQRRDGADRDARDGRVRDRGDRARVARRRGRHVEEGETVVEVSTDKVDAEVPAPPAARSPSTWSAPTRRSRSASPSPRWRRGPRPPATVRIGAPPPRARGGRPPKRTRCGTRGPVERRRRRGRRPPPSPSGSPPANGVGLGSVKGTGAGGKVTKADVLAASGDGKARGGPPRSRARPRPCGGRRRCWPRRWRRAARSPRRPRSAPSPWTRSTPSARR